MPRLLRSITFRARGLRRTATPAERLLWEHLRARRLDGIKFRRQQPLGPYIADFFSEEVRLVVEADGAGHFPQPESDRVRDRWLRAAGIRVLRLSNHEIVAHTQRALDRIRRAMREG